MPKILGCFTQLTQLAVREYSGKDLPGRLQLLKTGLAMV